MRFNRIVLRSAIITGAAFAAAAAHADNSPLGVWIDHTGRGAVEITDCNGKLCGHVAWVDDAKNSDQCGKQIIGNVKSVGKNKWDNGWIFDPDRGSKYDVEVTALNGDKLRVMGYAGTKWLSETYTWKRAPADIKRCNGDSAAATPAAPAEKTDTAKADATKSDATKTPETKSATEAKSEPIELNTAKSESDDIDNGKSDKTKSKSDKPAANETAKTEPAKPQAKDSADTANADTEDETSDEPKGKKGGKVVARLMEELESGDGPVKLKRSGKTCKVTAPFVGVVSFPCDGDKN
jgi:uncharacterized protein (DUF2147 family)